MSFLIHRSHSQEREGMTRLLYFSSLHNSTFPSPPEKITVTPENVEFGPRLERCERRLSEKIFKKSHHNA